MRVLLALSVLLPLAGAAATARAGRELAGGIGAASAAATGAATLTLVAVVWRDGPAPAWAPSLGPVDVVVVVDGLAAAMLAMTAVVGVAVSAFTIASHRVEPGDADLPHWPLWLLLWAGLHALFVAGDLFTIYLMLELVAVTGASLVALGGRRRTILAGTRYFYAELAASATFLVGIALVRAEAGTVVLAELPADLVASPRGALGLAAMTAGLLLKAPLFPLHVWLPAAHSLAPATVSPVLSAVVVKSAFAVLVRVWFVALPGAVPSSAAQLLGALGVAAIAWGSINALRVDRVKTLIAHSTVAQIGILFLAVPMIHAGDGDAWAGGVVHAVAHALAKAAALMAAAVLVADAPGDTVEDLGGAAARRPLASFAFGAAALSLVGLPPSAGFVAKWHLLLATFSTGQWWWAVVIVVGSLLTAAYLMRVVKQSFAPAAAGTSVVAVREPRELVALVLALGALAIGLRPTELLELVGFGAPVVPPGGG